MLVKVWLTKLRALFPLSSPIIVPLEFGKTSWNDQWAISKTVMMWVQIPQCCYNHFDTLLANGIYNIRRPSNVHRWQQINHIIAQPLVRSQWFTNGLGREKNSLLAAHQYCESIRCTWGCSITLTIGQVENYAAAIKLLTWTQAYWSVQLYFMTMLIYCPQCLLFQPDSQRTCPPLILTTNCQKSPPGSS